MDYIIIPQVDVPHFLQLVDLTLEGYPDAELVLEKSPVIAGATLVNVNYGERYGQLTLNVTKKTSQNLVNKFNAERFKESNTPYAYYKETKGGETIRGNDGSLIADTPYFISPSAGFTDKGGLQTGDYIKINGTPVQITDNVSDSLITVDFISPANESNVSWEYVKNSTYRKLEFVFTGGADFRRTTADNSSSVENFTVVAPFPFWIGEKQKLSWGDVVNREHKMFPFSYADDGDIHDSPDTVNTLPLKITSDAPVKPIITLHGYMDGFEIVEETSGKHLKYTDRVKVGEEVTIDLNTITAIKQPGNINVLKHLDGDLTTFNVHPFAQNVFTINDEAITGSSLIELTLHNLFFRS